MAHIFVLKMFTSMLCIVSEMCGSHEIVPLRAFIPRLLVISERVYRLPTL